MLIAASANFLFSGLLFKYFPWKNKEKEKKVSGSLSSSSHFSPPSSLLSRPGSQTLNTFLNFTLFVHFIAQVFLSPWIMPIYIYDG